MVINDERVINERGRPTTPQSSSSGRRTNDNVRGPFTRDPLLAVIMLLHIDDYWQLLLGARRGRGGHEQTKVDELHDDIEIRSGQHTCARPRLITRPRAAAPPAR